MTANGARSFLDAVYQGALVGDDWSVDIVYVGIRKRIAGGELDVIAQIFREVDVQKITVAQTLALLTITRALEGDVADVRADFHARASATRTGASDKIQSALRALR
ncbi:MAG: hypothetical protein ACHREM_08780 [Polyangiales bacterium]